MALVSFFSKRERAFFVGLLIISFFSLSNQVFGKKNKQNKQQVNPEESRSNKHHDPYNCLVPGSFTGSSVFTGCAQTYVQGNYPVALDYSPDGKYLSVVNFNEDSVASFSVGFNGLLTPLLHNLQDTCDNPIALNYSPDGTQLAVANFGEDNVGVYDVGTGVNGGQLVFSNAYTVGTKPTSLNYSPDGTYLAVANAVSDDVTVLLVSGPYTSVGSYPTGAEAPIALNYTPDGKYLAVANSGSDNVTVFSVDSGTGALTEIPLSPFSVGITPTSLNYSPNGQYLAVANLGSNNVTVFKVHSSSGALTEISGSPFSVGTSPSSLNYSPNMRYLAVANEDDNNVTLFSVNIHTGALTPVDESPVKTGSGPDTVKFSPLHTHYLAVGNAGDGTITEYTHCDED